jgi:hypothetical protein
MANTLILFLLFISPLSFAQNSRENIRAACEGKTSCFLALNGEARSFCEAYKENRSCFIALDGEERGWCEKIKENKSCFMALDGSAREECEIGNYPRKHRFWASCGELRLPPAEKRSPRQEACDGKTSCFMALDGEERSLCEAYKENRSCFIALNGEERGWCEVMKEKKSCFMALDGRAREKCEMGIYPRKHLYWASCGGIDFP